MTTKHAGRMAVALPAKHRARLMNTAHEVSFQVGTRLFEEGRKADRFWVVRTGTVTLDMHVPGRRSAAIESLVAGELVGWSWLLPPPTRGTSGPRRARRCARTSSTPWPCG